MMKVNYNKLWKLLIDRGMSKICKALNCQITDIMELIEEDEEIFNVT